MIGLMVEAGLVEEYPDPEDKRMMKIYTPRVGGPKREKYIAGTYVKKGELDSIEEGLQ